MTTHDRRSVSNPLLPIATPASPPDAPVEHSPVLRDQVEARYGPQTPLNIARSTGQRLQPWRVAEDPAVWVVGVHGGAGATTLAQLLGPGAVELAQHLPIVPRGAPIPRVLLVARTHATGLAHAAGAASQWATGQTGITLVGLAVVDDAPRLPKKLVAEIARVGGMVPALWHLPWCESWRTATATPTELPRRTRKSLDAIKAAANTARTTPTVPTAAAVPLRPPPPAQPEQHRSTLWATRPATDRP